MSMTRSLRSGILSTSSKLCPELCFDVSHRIREDDENGRHYCDLAGTRIALPTSRHPAPYRASLEWHNTQVFQD